MLPRHRMWFVDASTKCGKKRKKVISGGNLGLFVFVSSFEKRAARAAWAAAAAAAAAAGWGRGGGVVPRVSAVFAPLESPTRAATAPSARANPLVT